MSGNNPTTARVDDTITIPSTKGQRKVLASRMIFAGKSQSEPQRLGSNVVVSPGAKTPHAEANQNSWIMMIEDLQTGNASSALSPSTRSSDTIPQGGDVENACVKHKGGTMSTRSSNRSERLAQREHFVEGFFQSFQTELWEAFSPLLTK